MHYVIGLNGMQSVKNQAEQFLQKLSDGILLLLLLKECHSGLRMEKIAIIWWYAKLPQVTISKTIWIAIFGRFFYHCGMCKWRDLKNLLSRRRECTPKISFSCHATYFFTFWKSSFLLSILNCVDCLSKIELYALILFNNPMKGLWTST